MEVRSTLSQFRIYVILLGVTSAHYTRDFTLFEGARSFRYTLGVPFRERCVTSCIVTCQIDHASCLSVMYDPESKMCTPVIPFSDSAVEVTPSYTAMFYTLGDCNFSEGFALFTRNSSVSCLYLANESITFLAAREECRKKKAQLYIAKRQDTLDLFYHIVKNIIREETWIGLTDMEHTGTFTWEDGEKLNSSLDVWSAGEPNNLLGDEDCAVADWYWNFQSLNDKACSSNKSYICSQF